MALTPSSARVARVALAAVVGGLLIPTAARSANPTKGATYVGERGGGQTSLTKKVSLKVAPDGRSATAKLYCGTGRQPSNMPRFAIRGGRFRAAKRTGSVTLWTLRGRFTSTTEMMGTLNPAVTCNGPQGPITLTLKAPQ